MFRVISIFILITIGTILGQNKGDKPSDELEGKTPYSVIKECSDKLNNLGNYDSNSANLEAKCDFLIQYAWRRRAYNVIQDTGKQYKDETQILKIALDLINNYYNSLGRQAIDKIKILYSSACFEIADILISRKDYRSAQKYLDNSEPFSDANQLNAIRAYLYYEKGKYEHSDNCFNSALDYISNAIKGNQGIAYYYYQRSLIYGYLKKPDLEIDDIASTLKIDPNYEIKDLKKKGLSLIKLNNLSGASECFDNYTKNHKEDYEILLYRAEIDIKNNDIDNALNKLNKAIDNGLNSAECFFKRASVYYLLQRYDLSLNDAIKSKNLDQGNYKYWNFLGKAYLSNSMNDSALFAYNKSVMIYPNQPEVIKIKSIISIAINNKRLIPMAIVLFLLPCIILIYFLNKNKIKIKNEKLIVEKEYQEYRSFLLLADETASLTDQILSFFHKLLNSKIFKNDSIQEIKQSIDSFLIKKNKNELSIALMGEFSSGKSTIINALLEQNILASAIAPTTAIITEIRYSTEVYAKVVYQDNSEKRIELSELKNFLEEGLVAENVVKVIIGYPNDILKTGLVIYDTPGINVIHDKHINITKGILAQCNTVIYVDDITRPGKRESLEFLKLIISQVTKTIFILNKYDQIDPGDLPDVINYYKELILDKLSLKNPEIFVTSAKRELKQVTTKNSNSKEFSDFKTRLWKLMNTDRQLILAKDLARYLSDLLSNLESRLNDEKKFIIEELNSFVEHRIAAPSAIKDSLIIKIKEDLNDELTSFQSDYLQNVKSKLARALDSIISLIKSTNSTKILKPTTQLLEKETLPEAKRITERTLESIDSNINNKIESLQSKYYVLIENTFMNNFKVIDKLEDKTYYSNMFLKSSLLTAISIYSIYTLIVYLFNDSTDYDLILGAVLLVGGFLAGWAGYHIYYQSLEKKRSVSGGHSAYHQGGAVTHLKLQGTSSQNSRKAGYAGYIVGAALGGPIGGLIGGGVSAILGSLFGKKADVVKAEMINTFSNEYQNIESKVTRINIFDYQPVIINSSKEYLDSLSNKYSEVIKAFLFQDDVKMLKFQNKKELFSLINQKITNYHSALQKEIEKLRYILESA